MSALRARWKLLVPALLAVVGGGLYFFVLSSPPSKADKKVEGSVYVLPKEFIVNLRDGRFAKLTVGLVLEHPPVPAGGGHGAAVEPPEGFGPLEQEAVVRDLVTDEVTGASAKELITASGRRKLKKRLLAAIESHTDVHAHEVLLTDVAVQ